MSDEERKLKEKRIIERSCGVNPETGKWLDDEPEHLDSSQPKSTGPE